MVSVYCFRCALTIALAILACAELGTAGTTPIYEADCVGSAKWEMVHAAPPCPPNWQDFMSGFTSDIVANGSTTGNIAKIKADIESIDSLPEKTRLVIYTEIYNALQNPPPARWYSLDFQVDGANGLLTWAFVTLSGKTNDAAIDVSYFVVHGSWTVIQQYNDVRYKHCWHCSRCAWLDKCCCEHKTRREPRGDTPDEVLTQESYARCQAAGEFKATLVGIPQVCAGPSPRYLSENGDCALARVVDAVLDYPPFQHEIRRVTHNTAIQDVRNQAVSFMSQSTRSYIRDVPAKTVAQMLPEIERSYNVAAEELRDLLPGGGLVLHVTAQGSRVLVTVIVVAAEDETPRATSFAFFSSSFESTSVPHMLLHRIIHMADDGRTLGTETTLAERCAASQNATCDDIAEHLVYYAADTLKSAKLMPMKYAMLGMVPFPHTGAAFATDASGVMSWLEKAIGAAAGVWQTVVNAFKSTTSTQIKQVISNLSFADFHEKADSFTVSNVAPEDTVEFMTELCAAENITGVQKEKFMLERFGRNASSWEQDGMNMHNDNGWAYETVIYKNMDESGASSWVIVDYDAKFQLDPDLVIIDKKTSRFGGLFSSDEEEIIKMDHRLTPDDVKNLLNFFQVVAQSHLANKFGLPTKDPVMPF